MKLSMAPLQGLRKRRCPLDEDRERTVIEQLYGESDLSGYLRSFFALLTLSAVIATLGLVADSAAVVIGAMLVAPLMTPIVGAAAAVVRVWPARLIRSFAVVFSGALVAVVVPYIVATVAVVQQSELPAELLARTQPTLTDLGIALAAGGAGGYVAVRPGAEGAIPGVGISVSLVPPLAAAGTLFSLDRWTLGWHAILLFLTNLAAILLAAAIALVVVGFATDRNTLRRMSKGRMWGLAATVGAVVLVSIPLSIQTTRVVSNNELATVVADAVPAWAPGADIRELETDASGKVDEVRVIVMGPQEEPPVVQLARRIRQVRGKPVEVDLEYMHAAEMHGVAR